MQWGENQAEKCCEILRSWTSCSRKWTIFTAKPIQIRGQKVVSLGIGCGGPSAAGSHPSVRPGTVFKLSIHANYLLANTASLAATATAAATTTATATCILCWSAPKQNGSEQTGFFGGGASGWPSLLLCCACVSNGPLLKKY